jgi:hypothetical protein
MVGGLISSPPPLVRDDRTFRSDVHLQTIREILFLGGVRADQGLSRHTVYLRELQQLLASYVTLPVLQPGNDGLTAAEFGRRLILTQFGSLSGTPQSAADDTAAGPRI